MDNDLENILKIILRVGNFINFQNTEMHINNYQ